MKNIISLILVALCSWASYGQDIKTSNLTWSVSGMYNLKADKNVTYSCTFKSFGTDHLLWEQAHNFAETLTINSSQGTWTNVAEDGSIVYNVSFDGETGTVTFEKNSTGTFITLDISQGSGERLRQKYSVSQVTISNQ